MKRFIEPWEYFVIDNVLPEHIFHRVQNIVMQWDKPPAGKRLREDIEHQPNASTIQKITERYVYPLMWSIAGCNSSTRTEYNCQSKGHDYQIHTDVACKICSLVLHVSDSGTGTHIYNSKQQLHHTIPWSPNSATMFVNAPGTYHSFSSSNDYRVTLTSIMESS